MALNCSLPHRFIICSHRGAAVGLASQMFFLLQHTHLCYLCGNSLDLWRVGSWTTWLLETSREESGPKPIVKTLYCRCTNIYNCRFEGS